MSKAKTVKKGAVKTAAPAKGIQWKNIRVKAKMILATPDNAKIKTELGLKRLNTSLEKFGMAGSVVCNYGKKKGTYDLINGNSRWEKIMETNPETMMDVSVPSRPLTPKEYREMADMFDFATAGDVDMDRVNKHLGSSKDFYEKWGLKPPVELMAEMGASAKVEKKVEKPKKEVEEPEELPVQNMVINLIFTFDQEAEFRTLEEKFMKKYKTENTAETVLKVFKSLK